MYSFFFFFFFQAEDGIRDYKVTGVQTCALPIFGDVDRRGGRTLKPKRLGGQHRRRKFVLSPKRAQRRRIDRKSVGEGKRVDLGGRRIIKKKKKIKKKNRV